MLEWSEHFQRNGFRLAIGDPEVLDRAWQIELTSNEGHPTWYPDPETMRYSFFSKPGIPIHTLGAARRKRSELIANDIENQPPRP
jgi:hypothetical protein